MNRGHLRLVTRSDYVPNVSACGQAETEAVAVQLVEGFLANQRLRGLSEATIRRRQWTLTAFAAHIEPRRTDQATTVDVETFLSGRPTAATRRALLGDLRSFYRWAISRQFADRDPTLPVETPKVPRRLPSPLTRDELHRAWTAAPFPMRCVIGLGAGAGLRVSEIAALGLDDLDFDHRIIMVRNGKGGVDRAVPMASRLAELLQHAGPGDVVHWSRGDTVSKAVRRHFVPLEIRKRAHDLRHTFATEAARVTGGNMLIVAQLLGHVSVQTTQRYTAALPIGAGVIDELWQEAA